MRDISRRSFVRTTAGAAVSWPALGASNCLPKGAVKPPENQAIPLAAPAAKEFKFEDETEIVARPLLSEICKDPQALNRMTQTIQRIYAELANRSRLDCQDQTGLLYSTWWHDKNCRPQPEDVHCSWKFLPWHRAFLYFHERIIRKTIPGCERFRLPVWDWETIESVPSPYRQAPQCPLFPKRLPRPVETLAGIGIDADTVRNWLLVEDFSQFVGSRVSPPAQVPLSSGGPHSLVHKGINGLLGPTQYAAADPLFYAHHANMDRMWRAWMNQYPSLLDHQDTWKDERLYFFDERKCYRWVCIGNLLDEKKLGYKYDPAPCPFLYPYRTVPSLVPESPFRNVVAFEAKTLETVLSQVKAVTALTRMNPGDCTFGKAVKQAGLPLQFWAEVKPADFRDDEKRGYYLIGLRPSAQTAPSSIQILGSFALFSSQPSHHSRVAGVASLTPEKLNSLVQTGKNNGNDDHFKIEFVYGRADEAGRAIRGEPQPLAISDMYIRYPSNDEDYKRLFHS